MAKYLIGWGIAGGYGGVTQWAIVEHKDKEVAEKDAYERSLDDVTNNVEEDEDEYIEGWEESWIDYEVNLLSDLEKDDWRLSEAKDETE